MFIGIILLVILFAFGYNLVMLFFLKKKKKKKFSYVVLDGVDECLNDMCACNLNPVAPSLVSKRLKNKDWWSYLGLIT